MCSFLFKQVKLIIFLTIFLLFLIIIKFSYSSRYLIDFSGNDFSLYTILSERSEKHFVNDIYIDGNILLYDSNSDIYYYSFNDKNDLNKKEIIFDSYMNYDFYIDLSNFDYKIKNNQVFELYIYNSKYYQKANIVFTHLPMINIETSEEIGATNISSKVSMYDPEYKRNNKNYYSSYDSSVKTRGSLSSIYRKKSYKLKFNIDVSVFGLKNNNEWILDSLYSDASKVRNDLSSQIWNDIILDEKNSSIKNNLNCKYVEVFVDGKYYGLYSLKEHIDEKTVNLDNKFMFKGNGYHAMDFSNIYNRSDVIFSNFEFKYPKSDEEYDVFWYFTLSKIKKFYSSYELTDDILYSDFYIRNYIDYNLLRTFTRAVDNSFIKNIYMLYDYDKDKLIIIPWDLDQTFGQIWDAYNTDTYMKVEYDKYDELYYDVYEMFTFRYNRMIRSRYWELRNRCLNIDTINKYLDSYMEILVNSGAAKRDSDSWYQYDVIYEIENIRQWTKNRISFLDEYFK